MAHRSINKIVTIASVLLLGGTLLHPIFRPYLVFSLLNGLVLVNAVILYSNLRRTSTWTDAILGIAVIALTQITVTLLYPGLAGYLTFVNVILAQAGCLALTLIGVQAGWLRAPSLQTCRRWLTALLRATIDLIAETRATVLASAVAGSAFIFVFAVSALNPPISIDSLTQHMVQPVEWIQSGRIQFKLENLFATPHGNGIIAVWLLFPFHHDFVARYSQVLFILLGFLASYGICRHLRMDRALAIITALAVLTIPAYLAGGIALTDPDTQVAGIFLVSLYFALSLARTYQSATVMFLTLSLGLLLSAKFNSLYYGVPLVLLAIYGWDRGRRAIGQGAGWSLFFQGILMTIGPPVIGGFTYLYQLIVDHRLSPLDTIFREGSLFNIFIHRFSVVSFATSFESLRDAGVSVLLGLSVVYGVVRVIRNGRWQDLILPGFVCFSMVFPLAIYVMVGYYQGWQAIRHLLGMIALCVVLAGWTVSQLSDRDRRYGTWGLVGLIILSSCVGFLRQWPVHRIPTDIMATGLALAIGVIIWWTFNTFRKGHRFSRRITDLCTSTPVLLFGIWVGLLGLYGWEYAYRDYKYARWPPWYGFGTAWTHIGNATAEHGARIAYNVKVYPLFGYDLQNTLLSLMPDLTRQDTPEERDRRLRAWETHLVRARVDYVYVFALGPASAEPISEGERFDIVAEWADSRPEMFISIFQSGRELVYRLKTSSHIMSDVDGRSGTEHRGARY